LERKKKKPRDQFAENNRVKRGDNPGINFPAGFNDGKEKKEGGKHQLENGEKRKATTFVIYLAREKGKKGTSTQ